MRHHPRRSMCSTARCAGAGWRARVALRPTPMLGVPAAAPRTHSATSFPGPAPCTPWRHALKQQERLRHTRRRRPRPPTPRHHPSPPDPVSPRPPAPHDQPDEARLLSLLQQYWGYREFREPQLEIITSALAGKDNLVVMATGGGKSLCYQVCVCVGGGGGRGLCVACLPPRPHAYTKGAEQGRAPPRCAPAARPAPPTPPRALRRAPRPQVPALAMGKVVLVVSPLISLMHDQVDALNARGVPAAFLGSAQTNEEVGCGQRCVWLRCARGVPAAFLSGAQTNEEARGRRARRAARRAPPHLGAAAPASAPAPPRALGLRSRKTPRPPAPTPAPLNPPARRSSAARGTASTRWCT